METGECVSVNVVWPSFMAVSANFEVPKGRDVNMFILYISSLQITFHRSSPPRSRSINDQYLIYQRTVLEKFYKKGYVVNLSDLSNAIKKTMYKISCYRHFNNLARTVCITIQCV